MFQVETLQKDVEAKDAKIATLSSLLDESSMNAHLQHLTSQASELNDKIVILEDEKVEREREVGELREALEHSGEELKSISEQLGVVQEALEVAQISVQGDYKFDVTSVFQFTLNYELLNNLE